MWPFRTPMNRLDLAAKLAALEKSQAVIEFDLDGTILTANQNFLDAMGYRLDEVVRQKHAMFVEPAVAASAEYRDFWAALRRGDYQTGQFKRLAKGGREMWFEASYNPILDTAGRPYKVVKYATDVTKSKQEYADLLGQVAAINKSQAVIEFDLDGTILTANANFLNAVGYRLDEIQGRNHSLFVDDATRNSRDYRDFWDALRRGDYQAGQFKRIAKGGREIWIEGSYNPILDLNGTPYKVVKYATDITRNIELLANLKRLIDVNFADIDAAITQSGRQAGAAAAAAQDTTGDVQSVATAAEELAASVAAITESMNRSREASDSAFTQAEAAGEATRRLADAAQSMGGIVGLIQSIAGQINLLALNATIESARAGEAGRGFAVVANEVKNLANQAATATEQISREIEAVQSIAGNVVGALDGIRTSIDTVKDYVTDTASAMEEQSAVTLSMSHSMQSASRAVETISHGIAEISAAVEQANGAVAKTKEAAQVLAR
ncbi:methyl-accepting chemotaxis protein [Azospirillum fermentarium]|uniref:methyl-accepting chemotaxis protein n=1 Tax=Azospirillum fermentarium TaxID=1233114 RepID=UPI002225C04F|nr:PAS domain-containing methyl-accepting chemotaxis protein [Azospirillum fermentarium]MCW2245000.1 methyl-accepting chemotaxis protein [Azospirillum fermentarium]